jgi:hypothetical protein
MTTRSLSCALVLFCTVLAHSQEAIRQEWRIFRRAYPYHLQVVAISSPHGDGGRTLIVSEHHPI